MVITVSLLLVACDKEEDDVETVIDDNPITISYNGGIQETIEIINAPSKLKFGKGGLERIRELESESFNDSVDLYIEMSQRTTPCGTVLNPPEIARLKDRATAEQSEVIELYEMAINGELEGVVYVEGSPYDTTWRRLYNSEIEMLMEQVEAEDALFNDYNPFEYFIIEAAKAEYQHGFWYGFRKGTIYFDYYAYHDKIFAAPEMEYRFMYY